MNNFTRPKFDTPAALAAFHHGYLRSLRVKILHCFVSLCYLHAGQHQPRWCTGRQQRSYTLILYILAENISYGIFWRT